MKKLSLVVVLIIFVAAAAVLYLNLNKTKENSVSRSETLSFTENNKANNEIPKSEAPKKKQYQGQPLSFLGDPSVLSNYPKEFVENYRLRLANAVNLAQQHPNAPEYWLEIGIVKKVFNNYIGARDAWEYAKSIIADNAVIYLDLGNLYAFYLKDLKKAEANYQKAVELSPNDANVYLGLANFYKDVDKEKFDQIPKVLLAGLKILPDDLNLNISLAFYYKSVGDKENAIKYFEAFLKLPNITGAQSQAVENEIAALKS